MSNLISYGVISYDFYQLNYTQIIIKISEFQNWYMTDFLQYYINSGFKIKPVSIDNGWLELDTVEDYNLYNELYKTDTLTDFIDLKSEII